jgi:co-chaperonin GroES (HSP10)
VTVVIDKKDKKTAGGLILPDNYGDIFLTGVVRAVGPGVKSSEGYEAIPDMKPGDRVMLAQHSQAGPGGQSRVMPYPEIEDDGVKCVICNCSDILGVIA